MLTGATVWQFNIYCSPPEVSPSTHRANRAGLTQCKKGTFSSTSHCHVVLFFLSMTLDFFLEGVHGLEFTEGLDRGDVFLLGASSYTRLAFLRLLPFYQRFLLWGLHAPRHNG